MKSTIMPHTPEWFEKLRKINPQQAQMTAMAIKTAGGRTDVCTICGDANSEIYRTVDDPEMTLRLCDDCKKIQKQQHGLSVNPL